MFLPIYLISLFGCIIGTAERIYQYDKFNLEHDVKMDATDIFVALLPMVNTTYVVLVILNLIKNIIKRYL